MTLVMIVTEACTDVTSRRKAICPTSVYGRRSHEKSLAMWDKWTEISTWLSPSITHKYEGTSVIFVPRRHHKIMTRQITSYKKRDIVCLC